jgi:two-component system copper resistance phosphate regulon response regulator CusR
MENFRRHQVRPEPWCLHRCAFARNCSLSTQLSDKLQASMRGFLGLAPCRRVHGLTPIQDIGNHWHRMQILIAEDERKLAEALQKGLEAERHSVRIANTGEEAFFLISTEHFDLLLLDIMLPGRDGIEILTALRQKDRTVPVLILTSRDAIEDRVQGLDAGADDYLVKPIAFPELLARVRAIARRTSFVEAEAILKLAGLEMDLLRHAASREGRELTLTSREFELLEYLLRHQGHIVSREMLGRDVWKESGRYTPLDNVIDVHIARLRQKLDEPFGKKLLHTVRGVGFVLREKQ